MMGSLATKLYVEMRTTTPLQIPWDAELCYRFNGMKQGLATSLEE
jgi:hypothetical protein